VTNIVDKGWGHELIWASTNQYCGKLLNFKKNSRFSMHFHAVKDETWYVLTGSFLVRTINTNNAEQTEQKLCIGDVWHNPPLQPHQLICLEEGTILEVSTADNVDDNYRLIKGDSQK